jgi:WD40 repeat protein
VRRLPHESAEDVQLLFSNDGRLLAALNQRRLQVEERTFWKTAAIQVWDTQSGREVFAHTPADFYGWRAAFSPDGATLALAGEDRRVKVWSVRGGQELPELKLSSDCQGLHFAPDGHRLLTIHGSQMQVWDIGTGRPVFTLSDFAAELWPSSNSDGVEFSADGRRLFTCGDGTLKIWDTVDGQLLLTLRPAFYPLRLSADGSRLATGGDQGSISIWSCGPQGTRKE